MVVWVVGVGVGVECMEGMGGECVLYLALLADAPLGVGFFFFGLGGFNYGHGHIVFFFLLFLRGLR